MLILTPVVEKEKAGVGVPPGAGIDFPPSGSAVPAEETFYLAHKKTAAGLPDLYKRKLIYA